MFAFSVNPDHPGLEPFAPGSDDFIGPTLIESPLDSSSTDSSTSAGSNAVDNLDSLGILDLIKDLNNIERENTEASVSAQKELLSLQNEMNSAASELAWERYKDFDSTKVQRYIADMRAAGINPIIALGSGMPNISSSMPSASSVSSWTSQKASAQGESAIGKQQLLVQGYIGMIASLIETGISSAGNIVSSFIGKGTPSPSRTGMTRNYYKGGYSEQYFYN